MNKTDFGVRDKITNIESLALVVKEARSQGKKVVQCHGVFDLLHIGHIRHFEQAKKFGDVLIVTTTSDRRVNKGPGRPAFDENLRAEAIAALGCVDHVAINNWPTAVEAIRLLRPDFYVKGSDYKYAEDDRTGGIKLEQAAVEAAGGKLVFTDDITFSSSNLINRYLSAFPTEVSEYLGSAANRFSAKQVIDYLEGTRALKVLVIGETIIDEYVYCETLGKTGKEPVLAAIAGHCERFAGGVVAIANHVSVFADDVTMLSFLGETHSQEEFIREKVASNINCEFLYMGGTRRPL